MNAIDGSRLTLRPLQAWHEYLAAEELQRTVWQMPDWRDVVPANLLITAHKNGGILLGAFTADQALVGFAFSFLGVAQNHSGKIFKQCSHMLAVLPENQGQKIGEKLKFAQRQACLEQGVALMTWTYDPLLALNAMLNLVRLGAIARHYIVSAYGEMTDGLNVGLPSDRFEVEWWLNAPHVQACALAAPPRKTWDAVIQSGVRSIFDVRFDAPTLPRIERVNDPTADTLLLEIPANLGALKAADATLALDWRMRTRQAFQKYFSAGYIANDFVFESRPDQPRAAYLLTRQPIDLGTP